MCPVCSGKTVGEAESLYAQIEAGLILEVPPRIPAGHQTLADFAGRQLEEIDAGLFDDTPLFRDELRECCLAALQHDWPLPQLEERVVYLRRTYQRPVRTTFEVCEAVKANCLARGLPPHPSVAAPPVHAAGAPAVTPRRATADMAETTA